MTSNSFKFFIIRKYVLVLIQSIDYQVLKGTGSLCHHIFFHINLLGFNSHYDYHMYHGFHRNIRPHCFPGFQTENGQTSFHISQQSYQFEFASWVTNHGYLISTHWASIITMIRTFMLDFIYIDSHIQFPIRISILDFI